MSRNGSIVIVLGYTLSCKVYVLLNGEAVACDKLIRACLRLIVYGMLLVTVLTFTPEVIFQIRVLRCYGVRSVSQGIPVCLHSVLAEFLFAFKDTCYSVTECCCLCPFSSPGTLSDTP